VLDLAIGGSAIAIGDNTLADGTTSSTVENLGPITEAIGYASFVAVANSQPGDPAAADANTFANVSGADFVFEATLQSTLQSGPMVGSGETAVSTSQTEVVAIDILGWTPPNGPVELDVTIHEPIVTQILGNPSGSGEGHLATITANANAVGPNTLADTGAFALTNATDDHPFSLVSGFSISGIA
jgi:hypothetical protein